MLVGQGNADLMIWMEVELSLDGRVWTAGIEKMKKTVLGGWSVEEH